MKKEGAESYARDAFGYRFSDYEAVIRLRGKATTFLPEMDSYGNLRDESDWAYMDTSVKADTNLYGEIHYFCDMKWGWIKEEQ